MYLCLALLYDSANLIRVVFSLVILFAISGISMGKLQEEVIGQAIAASDLNFDLLSSGIANYEISYTVPSRSIFRVRVTLKNGKQQIAYGDKRLLIDKETFITFEPPTRRPSEPPYMPNECSAYIYPRSQLKYLPVHLQAQGVMEFGAIQSVADWIRAYRQNDSPIDMASQENGVVIASATFESLGARFRLELSPTESYVARRYQMWVLKDDYAPAREMTCTFQQLANGAHVCDKGEVTIRTVDPATDRLTITEAMTFRLIDISLQRPDDQELTINALGLPRGTRVQDRLRNTEYLFGIAAVVPDEIAIPTIYPPNVNKWNRWFPAGAAAIALICLTVIKYSRKRGDRG